MTSFNAGGASIVSNSTEEPSVFLASSLANASLGHQALSSGSLKWEWKKYRNVRHQFFWAISCEWHQTLSQDC